jgi:transcriptional regulator with XRE-family HTH domain
MHTLPSTMFYMEKSPNGWRHWGDRLRLHVRESRQTWATIAQRMELSEGTLRHWCNGTREINLADFFRLCDVTAADAHLILFGKPYLSEESARQLGAQVAELLTKDASLNPRYTAHSKALSKAARTVQQQAPRYTRTKPTKP